MSMRTGISPINIRWAAMFSIAVGFNIIHLAYIEDFTKKMGPSLKEEYL